MKTNPTKCNSIQGVALIIVMVVVLTLSVVVAGFAIAMKVETRLAMNNNCDSELEWIGRGGVEIARCAVGNNPTPFYSLKDFWAKGYGDEDNPVFAGCSLENVQFGNGVAKKITIVDLERKWNINYLAKSGQTLIIQRALDNMGVTDQSLASIIIESIQDWVDETDPHRFNGAKNDYYLHLEKPYYCKEGFMDDISELLLIRGIRENPEIYYGTAPPNLSYYDVTDPNVFRRGKERPSYPFGLKDVFTVMGTGRLNINTADTKALQLIPGVDERAAQAILTARAGIDGQEAPFQNVAMINGANIPGLPFGPGAVQFQTYCDVVSKYFEVTVEAEFAGCSRTYHAVICRVPPNPKEPKVVKFYWE